MLKLICNLLLPKLKNILNLLKHFSNYNILFHTVEEPGTYLFY